MKITIHRGIDQIGGCITEIATEKVRVLIDLGQNLPDGEGVVQDEFANLDTIAKITNIAQYGYYRPNHLLGFESVLNYSSGKKISVTAGIMAEYEQLAEGFSITQSGSVTESPLRPKKPEMQKP